MSPILAMLFSALGPLIVTFVNFDDDDPDDVEVEGDVTATPTGDPVETIDVMTFIENARGTDDNVGSVDGSRGTDQDEEFVAEGDTAVIHDASGGADSLTGSALNDTLLGGDGTDVIDGGDGDDALFGAFSRETRADDEAADTLVGGAGDDTLFMGDGDIGNGGEGRDVFVATQDAVEVIQISDFNVDEDTIAIETEAPEGASITEQVAEDGGLRIELSTGLSLRLEGVGAPLGAGSLQFVPVEPLVQS